MDKLWDKLGWLALGIVMIPVGLMFGVAVVAWFRILIFLVGGK